MLHSVKTENERSINLYVDKFTSFSFFLLRVALAGCMVSLPYTGSKSAGVNPARVIVYCVTLGETVNPHSAFLHPRVRGGYPDTT